MISAYQRQRSVTGGLELFPDAAASTYLTGSGSYQVQESPTFTFQPVTGEQFAQSFLRPLAPEELLSLAASGMPIDVLFRLAVQSVNHLRNDVALQGAQYGASAGFYRLIHDLRTLQIAGSLGIELQRQSKPSGKDPGEPGRVFLSVQSSDDPTLRAVAADARQLLGMRADTVREEVVFSLFEDRPGRHVGILTRSMLQVLAQLAFDVAVPEEDVRAGRTVASVPGLALAGRPVMMIRSGERPRDAYVAVGTRHRWFWIADEDFDSKVAFTVLQTLLALSKTSSGPGTVITIPAG